MRKKSEKRLAAKLIMYWIGEACNDLETPCYTRMSATEKEEVKYYIHRYGWMIGLLLRCRYKPHN